MGLSSSSAGVSRIRFDGLSARANLSSAVQRYPREESSLGANASRCQSGDRLLSGGGCGLRRGGLELGLGDDAILVGVDPVELGERLRAEFGGGDHAVLVGVERLQ